MQSRRFRSVRSIVEKGRGRGRTSPNRFRVAFAFPADARNYYARNRYGRIVSGVFAVRDRLGASRIGEYIALGP